MKKQTEITEITLALHKLRIHSRWFQANGRIGLGRRARELSLKLISAVRVTRNLTCQDPQKFDELRNAVNAKIGEVLEIEIGDASDDFGEHRSKIKKAKDTKYMEQRRTLIKEHKWFDKQFNKDMNQMVNLFDAATNYAKKNGVAYTDLLASQPDPKLKLLSKSYKDMKNRMDNRYRRPPETPEMRKQRIREREKRTNELEAWADGLSPEEVVRALKSFDNFIGLGTASP